MPSECSKHLAPFHQVVCNSAGVRGTFHVARAKKKSFFPPRHQIIFYHALHAIWALFVCTRYLKAGRSPEAILISIYCTVATFVRSPIRTSRGNSLLTEIQREERNETRRWKMTLRKAEWIIPRRTWQRRMNETQKKCVFYELWLRNGFCSFQHSHYSRPQRNAPCSAYWWTDVVHRCGSRDSKNRNNINLVAVLMSFLVELEPFAPEWGFANRNDKNRCTKIAKRMGSLE